MRAGPIAQANATKATRAFTAASFYPCTIDGACHGPEPWGLSWITAMFLHGGWDHILGNMLFLAIFGKNVEDAFGPVRYLIFYFAGGFVAMLTQSGITLLFGSAADARVPTLGASGAIAAVLGAYFVLYPGLPGPHLDLPRLPGQDPGLDLPRALVPLPAHRGELRAVQRLGNGGGVAFFAHVGGFLFGWSATRALTGTGTNRRPAGSLGLPCGASGVGTAITPP